MAGLDFNGTGLNTSKIAATGQPGLTGGAFTIMACILPDSAGQSNVGTIFQTAAGTTSRVWFRVILSATDIFLGLNVARSITATTFLSNSRKILPSGTTPTPAVVAATFDNTATPKVVLWSSGDGTVNDAACQICTTSTATAGTGTISTGDTAYTIGNIAAGGGTFDGVILWVAVWPTIIDVNEIPAIAAGINPLVGSVNDPAISLQMHMAKLDDASATFQDLARPSVLWTNTAVAAKDVAGMPGGESFAPGSGQILHYGWAQGVTPDGAVTDERDTAPTVVPPTPTVRPDGAVTDEFDTAPAITAGAVTLAPARAASDEVEPAPSLSLTVAPARAASDEADPVPTITAGAVSVLPGSAASDERDGTPGLAVGAVVVLVGAAPTDERDGSPVLAAGAVTVTPTASATDERDAAPTVTAGPVVVSPGGVGTAEAEGVPNVATTTSTVTPASAATDERDTAPTVSAGAITVTPPGADADEKDGAPAITLGGITVSPARAAGDELVGFPSIAPGVVAVLPAAARGDERFGNPALLVGAIVVLPASAASDDRAGTPTTMTAGPVTVTVVGVATDEHTGSVVVSVNLDVAAATAKSDEKDGAPAVTVAPITVAPVPALSDEQVGQLMRVLNRLLGLEIGDGQPGRIEIGDRQVVGLIEVS